VCILTGTRGIGTRKHPRRSRKFVAVGTRLSEKPRVRTENIDALGLSISKAADILKVRRATLSDLPAGKAALSPEMALRIEKAFGPDMDHLLRMQLAFDLAQTRSHAKKLSIKRYVAA
jgi:addiction module HigA family antidote